MRDVSLLAEIPIFICVVVKCSTRCGITPWTRGNIPTRPRAGREEAPPRIRSDHE